MKTGRQAASDDGYALVDALVAMLILSLALIFSFDALRVARGSVDQAREVRAAQTLIAQLLETGPRSLQDSEGVANGFSWRLQMRPTGSETAIPVCHRQVLVTNQHTHRAFQGATLETCPPEAGA